MIKAYLPTHFIMDSDVKIKSEELKNICQLSFNDSNYDIVEDKRGYNSGQYIKLVKDDIIKYVCLSRIDATESRDSFILQNFPTAYMNYLKDSSKNKSFEYYIRDTINTHAPYEVFAEKILITADIKILNIDKVIPSNRVDYLDPRTSFMDFNQMRKYRIYSQGRNSSNNSTQFEMSDEENEISVYGKTYGANGRETTAICLALQKLENIPIVVYNVNETDRTHLASVDPSNEYILKYYGINIDDKIMDFDTTNKDIIAKRNAKLYHYNLLKKFHEKKCYLCGCNIEQIVQGAHIYSYTDIIHSNESDEEKQKKIVDGENGFWLCENHHKLFDSNLIYFKGNKLEINKSNLDTKDINYIEESIYDWPKFYEACCSNQNFTTISQSLAREFYIKPEHFTKDTENYISIRNTILKN
jgi:hypothetical protein